MWWTLNSNKSLKVTRWSFWIFKKYSTNSISFTYRDGYYTIKSRWVRFIAAN